MIRDICLVGPTDAVIRLATILGHFEVLKELCISEQNPFNIFNFPEKRRQQMPE